MPTAPSNTKCASLGCKANRSKMSTFCIDHGGRDTYIEKKSDERKKFNAMYNSGAWKRQRQITLSKQPICQSCLTQGHIRSANEVDHLFAWSAFGKQSFTRNVFQALCGECHKHKTALEQKGIYRHFTNGKVVDYQLTDYVIVVGLEQATNAPEMA